MMTWALAISFALACIGFAVWAGRARDAASRDTLKFMACGWWFCALLTAIAASGGM